MDADVRSVTEDQVRAEVRTWLADNWSEELPRQEWTDRLVDSGWAAPTWPLDAYGRGLPRSMRAVVSAEFAAAGAPGTGHDVSNLYANVIQAYGSDEQRRTVVRDLATGRTKGCLLYSEPGAGSDLASVQTRAERTEGGWIVNGQKVWTSGAHTAQVGLLLARTDWDVPKHRGLSFFLFRMEQPGVDVRPIAQVTGGAHFNEVFLTDARLDDTDLLGELNGGWAVMQAALALERQIMGAETKKKGRRPSAPDPQSPWTREIGGTDYVALAKESGLSKDEDIRQEVVRIYSLEQVNRWNLLRSRAARGEGNPVAAASLSKLAMSRIVHDAATLTSTLLGGRSMLDGESDPLAAEINRSAFAAFVTSIGGGTDQIQRNIIGERVLGLPKEPEVDRDVAFKDVRKSSATRQYG